MSPPAVSDRDRRPDLAQPPGEQAAGDDAGSAGKGFGFDAALVGADAKRLRAGDLDEIGVGPGRRESRHDIGWRAPSSCTFTASRSSTSTMTCGTPLLTEWSLQDPPVDCPAAGSAASRGARSCCSSTWSPPPRRGRGRRRFRCVIARGAAPISWASRAMQRAPLPHISTSPPSGIEKAHPEIGLLTKAGSAARPPPPPRSGAAMIRPATRGRRQGKVRPGHPRG